MIVGCGIVIGFGLLWLIVVSDEVVFWVLCLCLGCCFRGNLDFGCRFDIGFLCY